MRHTKSRNPVRTFPLLVLCTYVCVHVCMYVFQSVTAYGRAMIEQTKQEVEQHYNVTNGYQNDAEVNTFLYLIKGHTIKT
jgi:DNA polymerase elongation subunit (family B)